MAYKEADFEAAIVESLVEDGGYVKGTGRPSTLNWGCSSGTWLISCAIPSQR